MDALATSACRVAVATRTPGNRLRSYPDGARASSCWTRNDMRHWLKTPQSIRSNENTWSEDARRESLRQFPASRRARHARTRPPRGMPSSRTRTDERQPGRTDTDQTCTDKDRASTDKALYWDLSGFPDVIGSAGPTVVNAVPRWNQPRPSDRRDSSHRRRDERWRIARRRTYRSPSAARH